MDLNIGGEMFTIKEMVKDRRVKFVSYRKGNLWYKIEGLDFEFPVPVSDAGDAEFKSEDKAMLYMRYIRKHKEMLEKGGK